MQKLYTFEGQAAEIVDHITDNLERKYKVKKLISEQGIKDEQLDGKIQALEELRDWIAVRYF